MSTGACRWPSVSTANTATWQLSTLPRRPHHCRATPTECSPLLGEAALIDDQRAGRLATEQTIGVAADLLHHRLVPPRRVADEVLELLLAALLNHRRHRREGRFLRLRKPLQVALRHRRVVPRPSAEEPTVTADEAAERHRDALDQRCRRRSPISRTYGNPTK